MKSIVKETTRFEARLLKEQKVLFEKVIIKENEQIISSVDDAEIFYDALVNPAAPSEKLKKAFKNYSEQFTRVK